MTQTKAISKPEKTKAFVATDYKLVVPHDIHQKILYYMTKSSNEISGYGSLSFDDKANTFTVKDIIILKQSVSPTSTELDPHAIGKAMFEMRDEPMGMKWHWHTHPNMGCFWSADDMEVIRQHGQQGWIIASVFNEKGEHRSAFHTTTEVMGKKHDIFQDNLETSILSFYDQSWFDALDKSYAEKVTEEKVAAWAYSPGHVYDATAWEGYEDPYYRPLSMNYNNVGYAKTSGGNWVYNPLHDEQLPTDEEKLLAIEEMEPFEIQFLKTQDPAFAKLLTRFETMLEGNV